MVFCSRSPCARRALAVAAALLLHAGLCPGPARAGADRSEPARSPAAPPSGELDPSEEITPEELASIPEPVPAATPPPVAPPPAIAGTWIWRVQILATPDEELAERVARESSERLGTVSRIDAEPPLHKVRLGAFNSEGDAQILKARAVEMGYPGAFRVKIRASATDE